LQHRGHSANDDPDFGLQIIGLGLQRLHAASRGAQCHHGSPTLGRLMRTDAQASAAAEERVRGQATKLLTKLLRRGHDQGLQMADGLTTRLESSLPGAQQNPQSLAISAAPG